MIEPLTILVSITLLSFLFYALSKERDLDTEYFIRVNTTIIVIRYLVVTLASIWSAHTVTGSSSLFLVLLTAAIYNSVVAYAIYATLRKTKQVLKYFAIEMSTYSALALLAYLSAALK